MNKITTLFFGICLSIFAIQAGAQVYIWGGPDDANSRFTDGINDWTVDGMSTGANGLEADPDAVFIWEAMGSASAGAFAGATAAIVSPSLSDGAMVFNSDFMDNEGKQNNFGNGPAPAPQLSHLTSPEFSCDGHASVSVKFHQHLRHFQSEYYLDVTTDGGNTWIPFALNTDAFAANRLVLTNTLNFRDAAEVIDISSVAANQSAVQIRFRVVGNYYYWILDDVMVLETPETDLVLGDCLYSASNYSSPEMSLTNDSFFFASYIYNKSATVQKDIELITYIMDAQRNVLSSASQTIDELGIGDTLRVEFEDAQAFMPNVLPVGEYIQGYLLSSGAGTDFNLTDNVYERQFNVTDDTYQKTEPRSTIGYRPGGNASDYGMAAIFVTGSEGASFKVNSMDVRITESRNDPVFTGPDNFLSCFLLELDEDYDDPYFNTFDFTQTGIDANENFIVLGSGEEGLQGKTARTSVGVDLFNDDDDSKPLCLKSNRTYLLLANLAGIQGTAFTGFNEQGVEFHQFENIFTKAQLTYLILNGEDWSTGFSNTTGAPLINMAMELNKDECGGVSSKDIKLSETSVTVSPNPTVEFINVNMNYSEVNSGTLVMTNVDGKVLERRVFSDVQNSTERFDVNHLPAGSYMINIFSDLGNRAIPFIVK